MSDKIEQITGVIGDPKSWKVVEHDGGELVQVELRPGVRVRMRKAEAIAKGLWRDLSARQAKDPEPKLKAQLPRPNKQRKPGRNKEA